jgi:F-type H+-transporting ATPase subunit b
MFAGSVLAETAEHAPGGAEHAGGLPQLNPASFPTQIFWLALTFATLYYLMSKKALPRVAEVLEERQQRISGDLAKAAALRDEAEAVMASVEKSVAEARSQARTLVAQVAAEIEANSQARQSQLSAEIAERLRQAEARITTAKDAALANVRAAATDIAQDIASKLTGVNADAGQVEAAVAAVIEERR